MQVKKQQLSDLAQIKYLNEDRDTHTYRFIYTFIYTYIYTYINLIVEILERRQSFRHNFDNI